jgi:quercetin dioxygenase-like cupin family protein
MATNGKVIAPIKESDRWNQGEATSTLYADSLKPSPHKQKKKVLTPQDMPWEDSPQGRIKHLAHAKIDLRIGSVDAYMQEIPPGSRSGKHRHMADEVLYVLEGRGYDLHWDSNLEIGEEYVWSTEEEPSRHEWEAGDLVYIPVNTVHQHFNLDADRPARFICAQNRAYKSLGYDEVEQFETAPEWAGDSGRS